MSDVLRGAFGYLFLVFIVRIVGRRPGKQMIPFEFVLIFFMGGLILTPMVGDNQSITAAYVLIFTVASMHFLIAWFKMKSKGFGSVVDGTPLVLLDKGRWRPEAMRRMRISDDDVMAAARDKGMQALNQIDYAVLERNGEISVIPKSES